MAISTHDRTAIWKSMLDAEMNYCYWNSIVKLYTQFDMVSKIFLALMASSTVASWTLWSDFDGIWKFLSAMSAVLSITLPIVNFQKTISTASNLAGSWGELKADYSDLWRKVQNNNVKDFEKHFTQFQKIQSRTTKKEIGMPNKKKLLTKCQNEVLNRRKLKKD